MGREGHVCPWATNDDRLENVSSIIRAVDSNFRSTVGYVVGMKILFTNR